MLEESLCPLWIHWSGGLEAGVRGLTMWCSLVSRNQRPVLFSHYSLELKQHGSLELWHVWYDPIAEQQE